MAALFGSVCVIAAKPASSGETSLLEKVTARNEAADVCKRKRTTLKPMASQKVYCFINGQA